MKFDKWWAFWFYTFLRLLSSQLRIHKVWDAVVHWSRVCSNVILLHVIPDPADWRQQTSFGVSCKHTEHIEVKNNNNSTNILQSTFYFSLPENCEVMLCWQNAHSITCPHALSQTTLLITLCHRLWRIFHFHAPRSPDPAASASSTAFMCAAMPRIF